MLLVFIMISQSKTKCFTYMVIGYIFDVKKDDKIAKKRLST